MDARRDNFPPPVPPRPPLLMSDVMSQHSIIGAPMNPYGIAYGYGPPYSGTPYSSATVYGNYGCGVAPMNSSFARLAEESSRGAFQSIEAVVTAVTSVANMLNSTQNAIYSSFRAVIGVVEQFSRLKSQLVSMVVALSVLRWLKRLWRTILVLLRFKPANYSAAELAWQDVTMASTGADWVDLHGAIGKSVNWPAMLFWLVALGGPYLIYKCLSRLVTSVEESRRWATGCDEHYDATALYDFNGQNERELSFCKGQTLRVAPKHQQPAVRGWLLASSKDGDRVGLVPVNYVEISGRKSVSPPLRSRGSLDGAYESALRSIF
uniref:Peroxisomal membrane protein PEX13 n=1 Tax=Parascaris univalens TaxID=6257 RepID=A0A915AS73_PARUN